MNNSDTILRALKRRADERGYVRTTLADLTGETGLSQSTVQRAISSLAAAGLLQKRSKGGPAGGLLVKLESWSNPGQNPGQTDQVRDDSARGAAPTGPSPTLPASNPGHPGQTRPTAWRQARPEETPESGAELVYTNDDENGQWHRLNATLWIAPNGDAVSIRSMTPERRRRLRVEENEDGSPNLEAIKALRTIMDR
jgi:DNA-binding transcriptional MocR family regulator